MKNIQKLSKRNAKNILKKSLKGIEISCQEDNLERFEYCLSNIFKIIFMNFKIANLANANSEYVSKFVYLEMNKYKPRKIQEKFLKEFAELNHSLEVLSKSLKLDKLDKLDNLDNKESN